MLSALGRSSGSFSRQPRTRPCRGWSGPISSRSSLRRQYSGITSPPEDRHRHHKSLMIIVAASETLLYIPVFTSDAAQAT